MTEDSVTNQSESFPKDNNVRVIVAGLAICELDPKISEVKFLRHLEDHILSLRIVQKLRANGNVIFDKTLSIQKDQNIEISGSTATRINSHIYQTNEPNKSLDHLVGMGSLHGTKTNPKKINTKINLPTPVPSFLKLHNFAFYSHELTKDLFQFYEGNRPKDNPSYFCLKLGSYMNFQGTLRIQFDKNPLPTLPEFPSQDSKGNEFIYEISFDNACETKDCENEEDFKYIYDILEEDGNVNRRFEMRNASTKLASTGTGACLPVCRTC